MIFRKPDLGFDSQGVFLSSSSCYTWLFVGWSSYPQTRMISLSHGTVVHCCLQWVYLAVFLCSFLTNCLIFSYPSTCVDFQFRRFLTVYSIAQLTPLPFIENENQYFSVRQHLAETPTWKQTHLIRSTCSTRLQSHTQNQIFDIENSKSDINKEKIYENYLIVHCINEKRLAPYKRDMHQVWNKIFHNTPAPKVRLIIGNKKGRNIHREFVWTSPLTSVVFSIKVTTHDRTHTNKWMLIFPMSDWH